MNFDLKSFQNYSSKDSTLKKSLIEFNFWVLMNSESIGHEENVKP
jgi:hypothetical protein